MALTVATIQARVKNDVRIYAAGLGENDNDVIVQADDVSGFREFELHSTAGACDVFVSLDGTTYSTAALSMFDLGSASFATAVVVTAANRVYKFTGCFQSVRVLQNGATPPTAVTLLCY
jgi:hypothetical protein